MIKKNHFIPEKSNQYIIYIGFPVIWALWLIVTLVYSEVILGLLASFNSSTSILLPSVLLSNQ